MPAYDYYCAANQMTVEVVHSIKVSLKTWGEVCQHAKIPLGDTPPHAAVERLISSVTVSVPVSDSKWKEKGFTKLVRRDQGVYENVTATEKKDRLFKAEHLLRDSMKKKLGD